MIEMPPALERAWHTHGYYGSVSHNVKAIYQRYMGWYDGNPARLWQHPPEERRHALRRVHGRGRRGGGQGPAVRSRPATCAGPPRSSTTWCSPSRTTPRPRACWPTCSSSSATAAENGTWRCESTCPGRPSCASGNFGTPDRAPPRPTSSRHLSPEMLFDALAVQVDGPRGLGPRPGHRLDAARPRHVTTARRCTTASSPTSRTATSRSASPSPCPRRRSIALAGGDVDAARAAGPDGRRRREQLSTLFGVLQPGDPDFNIVEP